MRQFFYALPILCSLIAARPAHSYNVQAGGSLAGTSHTLFLNPDVVTALPDHFAALQTAATKVNGNASAMRFTLTADDDLVQSPNNGESEVDFVVKGASTCGSIACEFSWFSGGVLVETDVNFDVNGVYALTDLKTDSIAYGGPGRPLVNTAIHEFTHSLGMAHENQIFQIMGDSWNVVSTNGDHTEVAESEDTTTGLISLYGARSPAVEDVSAYHWKYLGASGAYSTHTRTVIKTSTGGFIAPTTFDHEPSYTLAGGTTYQVEQTLENRGNNSRNVKVRWYLSTDSTISSADTSLQVANVGLNPNVPFTFAQSVTIPANTASGTYWLGLIVDDDNAVSEANEVNNAAYIARVVIP